MSPMETTISTPYPPLVKRFQSLFVDQVFIIICIAVLSMLLGNPEDESLNWIRALSLFGLFFVYEPLCMVFGCTVGNFVSGIRVRRFSDPTRKINLFQSYLRFIVKLLLGIISFFTVTSDEHKRALHDKASGSVMIYKPKA